MPERVGLVLLTGLPGIGKTTLVRKVCEDLLNKHNVMCNGFYTEEVRSPNKNERIEFDIVTLNKKRGILSRKYCTENGPLVGKYYVNVKEIEEIVVPLIRPSFGQEILVIDEVGKMELKSKKFEKSVKNCIMKTILLATIPYNSRPLHLVDELKNNPKAQIIVVTKENRNRLKNEILERILLLVKN